MSSQPDISPPHGVPQQPGRRLFSCAEAPAASRCVLFRVALSLWLAMLVVATFPQTLRAATTEEGDGHKASAAQVVAAQALFEQGRALVMQGRAQVACPKFEESQLLDPGLGTQFNLADCYERLGRLESALVLFTKVAATARETGQIKRERVARARAAALRPRLTLLTLVVPPDRAPELPVERDGMVPSDVGVHRVAVPVREERAYFDPLHRKLGLAAAGVGVVGVSVGSFFGARAILEKNEANRAGCDGRQCVTPESAAHRDRARSAGDIATVAMGIGAAGLATAAVLLWVVSESRTESEAVMLDLCPVVATRGGGMLLRGLF